MLDVNTIFEFPKSCELNKVVYKKFFFDNAALTSVEKKILREDVDKIKWLHTLKPSTININVYHDKIREYPEIAVLLIELSKNNRIKSLSGLIHKSIPYPLVVIFKYDNNLLLSIADKRINQGDVQKWVVEDILNTNWIDPEFLSSIDKEFITSLSIKNLSTFDFFSLYQDIKKCFVSYLSALKTGKYNLGQNAVNNDTNIDILKELEKLEIEQTELKNKLKKEKQMGKRVDINTRIKGLSFKVEELKKIL